VAGCSDTPVTVIHPYQGTLVESFSEQARTRLRDTYPVTMPVQGRISRIGLEKGDRVTKGDTLVDFDQAPLRYEVQRARAAVRSLQAEIEVKDDHRLENTVLVEARATIRATEEALKAADEQVAAEKARMQRAEKHFQRMKKLAEQGAIPDSKMDDATLTMETTLIEYKRQQFYRAALNAILVAVKLGPDYVERYLGREQIERKVLVGKLEEQRAVLAAAQHKLDLARITAPVSGEVLEKYTQGDATYAAGTRLLLIGNVDELEAMSEVLTEDALRIKPGSAVRLKPSAHAKIIPGRVRRIDPAGFTKRSSLGVEQQRVMVYITFDEPPPGLGVGFQLQARFITGSKDDALIVPRYSVLQRPDGNVYVQKIVDREITEQDVTTGLQNDMEIEIISGLASADRIVGRPDAETPEGTHVEPVTARSTHRDHPGSSDGS
jgi:HlyD family secretion protein